MERYNLIYSDLPTYYYVLQRPCARRGLRRSAYLRRNTEGAIVITLPSRTKVLASQTSPAERLASRKNLDIMAIMAAAEQFRESAKILERQVLDINRDFRPRQRGSYSNSNAARVEDLVGITNNIHSLIADLADFAAECEVAGREDYAAGALFRAEMLSDLIAMCDKMIEESPLADADNS